MRVWSLYSGFSEYLCRVVLPDVLNVSRIVRNVFLSYSLKHLVATHLLSYPQRVLFN
jgi:hypothetical protein